MLNITFIGATAGTAGAVGGGKLGSKLFYNKDKAYGRCARVGGTCCASDKKGHVDAILMSEIGPGDDCKFCFKGYNVLG